ncbi:MAG: DUF4445 domain-containing protein [Candidatus Omnitrophica bacterium]|nr:DUF4445 domain-containing protein [Candidatus Omnitrophota bacterium]
MPKYKVTFYPDNKSILVEKDTTILSAALSCGIYINSACGGDGVCGRCKVMLKKGKVITTQQGPLSLQERKKQTYLACNTTIHSDAEIEVPQESRVDFEELSQEEVDTRLKGLYAKSEEIESAVPSSGEETFAHAPLTKKLYLELPAPNLEDCVSDLERLYRSIAKIHKTPCIQTSLTNIRQLSALLRDSEWKVTVTIGKRDGFYEIVLVEPSDKTQGNLGICCDIGTTTITCQLVDLHTNKILGTKATYNKQSSFGSDVITRIIYAQEQGGLEQLHYAVVDTINHMTRELIQEHAIDLNEVTSAVCAGNTTMLHLLLCIDPTYIRREPYIPTANFLPTTRAAEAGITITPRGILTCIPGVSSYVGADTTAGVLASGLYARKELSLLIDIGTNGEIVLGNKEFMVACAASAGPAFEGSGVACGMRASHGAIQKVSIHHNDWTVHYKTIGNTKPRGICGSGYIDLIAAMLKNGLLDKDGKITVDQHRRIRQNDSGKEFIVAFKDESDATMDDIVISETDIENLKRSKGAIYSAVSTLVRHMELNLQDIQNVFIAGGFGTYLDIENAITIGLLPDLERNKIRFLGNTSLAGARMVLLSEQAAQKADEIARTITYFELSVDPGYMDEYGAALFFPHTDLSKFPSVNS